MRDQRGQVTTLAAVFMLSVLGLGALVVDVGAWFHAHRSAQATADAAALAGAQRLTLPYSQADARALALEYADENGGGVVPGDVTFSGPGPDTITVEVDRPAQTFFSKVLGFADFVVTARASARAAGMDAARWAAPIAVDERHPFLSGTGCPCFNQPTTLDLKKTGPGAFRIMNIDGSHGGTGQPTLAEWIRRGHSGFMPLDWYYSDPGAKYNSGDIDNALDERVGTELLFPIYRQVREQGAGFEYQVVGWVGFLLTDAELRGSSGSVSGSFTRVIWEGIQSTSGPAFGVTTIELVE
jgi:hypothetical protein